MERNIEKKIMKKRAKKENGREIKKEWSLMRT